MFLAISAKLLYKKFRFNGIPLPAPQHDDDTVESDEIPIGEVQSIIKGLRDQSDERISTNDVLSAMVLRKIIGSRRETWGDQIHLNIPIDVRHWIPEYGRRFVGNALQLHTLSLDTNIIMDTPIPKIAHSIRASMPTITRESYTTYLTELEEVIGRQHPDAFRPFDPEAGYLVTNLTRMPTNRLDFGSGPPTLIFPLTTGRHAAALMRKDDRYILRVAY